MNKSESFKHGMWLNESPPDSMKSSLDSSPISSIVSRQSDTNPGQNTCIFLTPSLGRDSSLLAK